MLVLLGHGEQSLQTRRVGAPRVFAGLNQCPTHLHLWTDPSPSLHNRRGVGSRAVSSDGITGVPQFPYPKPPSWFALWVFARETDSRHGGCSEGKWSIFSQSIILISILFFSLFPTCLVVFPPVTELSLTSFHFPSFFCLFLVGLSDGEKWKHMQLPLSHPPVENMEYFVCIFLDLLSPQEGWAEPLCFFVSLFPLHLLTIPYFDQKDLIFASIRHPFSHRSA